MRILFLHGSSDLYGASKIFLQTIKIVQQKGHNCIVILSSEGPLVSELESLGVQVEIANLGILRRKYFTPLGLFNRLHKWFHASIFIQKIINEQKIELVYSNTAAVLIGGWAVSRHNKKQKRNNEGKKNYVKVQHIWHLHEIITSPNYLHRFIKWCLVYWSDKIIVVSEAVRAHWLNDNKENQKKLPKNSLGSKMNLIYNGIEPLAKSEKPNYRVKYAIPSDAIVIGMAGRIHYLKGQEYFIKIAQCLLEDTSIYFIITGDPYAGQENLLTEMKAFIKEHQLEKQVIYTGYEAEMDCFYSAINILLLPSILPDSFPTVVLEAMQFGLPVVATEQGGAMEMIIADETGIFIPILDEVEAAKKIKTILPEDRREQMGVKGKERVAANYSAKAFEDNLVHLINNLKQ
jgi:glycosyltransferase involved in cell wall biosynthesis